ncbi:MAG TPA: SRPBCC domain-containing protein [Steroidobacteraceae bacterium]|jgi:uncharacterized protein YndB with AHSA1/START domain
MSQNLRDADRRSIVVDYHLSAPPPKVWRALTEPKLLASWLMPNDIKPKVGHQFTFKTAPAPGFDGIVHCKIIEVQPVSRLVYSWRGGPIDTMVIWTLEPTISGGTHLKLEQSGFGPEHGMTYDILSQGWREKAAGSLERIVNLA